MSTISLCLNERDHEIIKHYAQMNSISISNLLRDAAIEKIEDELDISLFDNALANLEHTYSHQSYSRRRNALLQLPA